VFNGNDSVEMGPAITQPDYCHFCERVLEALEDPNSNVIKTKAQSKMLYLKK